MPSAKLIIVEHDACESKYIIKYNNIIKTSSKSVTIENNKLRRNSSKSAGDYCVYDDVTPTKVNGIFLHYFIKELENSHIYRRCVLRYFKRHLKYCNYVTVFMLVPPCRQIIDYQWADRASLIAWERAELDHAMSWLSTLGGAFSALGEEFIYCAEMAGKISYHQLRLALRLGDPTTVARCKLYLSLSLIQRGSLLLARRIILEQYNIAKNSNFVDARLINMCKGIWSKLQYCWKINKAEKI
ncbi:uncharacterized protein F58A4.6, partial [Ctenocephalides felis]|uniref:uncharacterized protein F58A4.6 n=1 Tax=Ctenocephalides felis TaxID=7515 RepID=UPI000E6E2C64